MAGNNRFVKKPKQEQQKNNRFDEETKAFISLVREKNITAILDGKQQRNAQIYQNLQAEMLAMGFEKPWTILRSKWKSLKQRYMGEKRDMSRSGSGGKYKSKFRYFAEMDEILGQRPIVASLSSVINSSGDVEHLDEEGDDRSTVGNDDEGSEESEESPTAPDYTGSEANSSPSLSDIPPPQRSAATGGQRFWSRSPTNKTPTRRQTAGLDALLKHQQEEADKDRATLQSLSNTLEKAVNCFERCARACEVMAAGSQANRNTVQGHFQTHTVAVHNDQSYSHNQQWSSFQGQQQSAPFNPNTSADTHASGMSYSSFLNL